MKKNTTETRHIPFRRLFFAPFLLIVSITIVSWFWQGWSFAKAIFLGALAWFIPMVIFSIILFRKKQKPYQLLKDFYLGELAKLTISALLIAMFLIYCSPNLSPFILGYVITVFLFLIITGFLPSRG